MACAKNAHSFIIIPGKSFLIRLHLNLYQLVIVFVFMVVLLQYFEFALSEVTYHILFQV